MSARTLGVTAPEWRKRLAELLRHERRYSHIGRGNGLVRWWGMYRLVCCGFNVPAGRTDQANAYSRWA